MKKRAFFVIIPIVFLATLFMFIRLDFISAASTFDVGVSSSEHAVEVVDEKTDADMIGAPLWDEGRLNGSDVTLTLGASKDDVLNRRGSPNETGMYAGGIYMDYQDITYFINPETDQMSAMAMKLEEDEGEALRSYSTRYESLLREKGMNEKDGLWMESYRHGELEWILESEDESSPPKWAWLFDKSISSQINVS
ncbi:hypothetical protein [Texcoconibacillus texcoconensis]|uniref:Uncharacterized protein n=1 Tax=Texcoconibacillus texcoconensis TaxID=1095777 RepID=A0A840QLK3_9BACI|nr:hypothetical protein [Texcoconibacillus texcoconensis]MBB5172254.1 hypothetical protein [Texcoconibacillus texcoconensis]